MIVNPPSSYFRAVAKASASSTASNPLSGVKRKSDGDGNSDACRTRQEPARGEKRNSDEISPSGDDMQSIDGFQLLGSFGMN